MLFFVHTADTEFTIEVEASLSPPQSMALTYALWGGNMIEYNVVSSRWKNGNPILQLHVIWNPLLTHYVLLPFLLHSPGLSLGVQRLLVQSWKW